MRRQRLYRDAFMEKLLRTLNPEQATAVRATEGPLLVLAGAGTGKTRVITYRIANLLAKGVAARNVLAMTFTNKAAREMRERVAKLVGRERAAELTVGTFHSFCARSLREHAPAIGLPRNFTICDGSDQLSAVKGVLRELRIAEAVMNPRVLHARISLLKNRLVGSEEFLSAAGDDSDRLVGEAYARYEEHLGRARTLDFDDLLLRMVDLLARHEHLRAGFQDRFRYVLVDEYQDTNGPQYEIVRRIAGRHRNLCVVGDDDQSIYGWRGADVRKILDFEKDFRGAQVVRLTRNYRSTRQILDAANAVIRCNPARHDKALVSELGSGDAVDVRIARDEEAEAEHVVREIATEVKGGHAKFADFAILFRTATQPRAFEAQLRAAAVPYTLVGGMSFFDRKEVRDLLAFLRLVVNPDDEVSLLRVLNTPPRGVGKSTVKRVLDFATAHGIGAGAAFDRSAEIEGVPESAATAVRDLRTTLAGLRDRPGGLVDLVREVIDRVDYRVEVERCYPDPETVEARWAAVNEVLNFAENHARRKRGGSLPDFLEELTLTANDDTSSEGRPGDDKVMLMTLHSAKGLEFPRVFLVGVEEGLLPHAKCLEGDSLEEERRLMYVGITRAQRRLTVTFTRERAKYGRRAASMPSRFVFEMTGRSPPEEWRAGGARADAPPARVKGRKRPARSRGAPGRRR